MTILVSGKAAVVDAANDVSTEYIWVESGEIRFDRTAMRSLLGRRLLRMMMLFHRKVPQHVVMPLQTSSHIQV